MSGVKQESVLSPQGGLVHRGEWALLRRKTAMTNLDQIMRDVQHYVLGTYKRKHEGFSEGRGSWLKSVTGKKVLDFFPGWGSSNLGHCHPRVVKAIQKQVGKIIHMANVFYSPLQAEYAKRLIGHTFPGKVFFCNSGAESLECAIKAARAWGKDKGKNEFVSFYKSFHGRTVGALTLTAQSSYQDPFAPLMPHVHYAEYNNLASTLEKINDKTCAVVLELVQGEGGIRVADKAFIRALSCLSKEKGFLLIFDEVQTGFGRTGKLFAFQNYKVKPDILCLAKSIAGGAAMGATILSKPVSEVMKPGMHASTFGGNYLVVSGALAVLEAFEREKILEKMLPIQKKLEAFFEGLKKKYSQVVEFRHLGMMFGIEMKHDYAARIADRALEEGLIINCTSGNVLRIMPALNLRQKDCDQGIKILEKVFAHVCKE